MKRGKTNRWLTPMRVLLCIDLVLVVLAVTAAANLRFLEDPEGHTAFLETAALRALLVAAALTTAMSLFGLYQSTLRYRLADLLLRVGLSFAFGGSALLVVYYAFPPAYIGRGVLAMALGLSMVAIVATRVLAQRVVRSEAFKRRILVLGAGGNANLINERLRRTSDRSAFAIVGFVPLGAQPVTVDAHLIRQPIDGLAALAESLNVAEIVVAPDERRGAMPMEEMLMCAQRGIQVTDLSSFFEREAGVVTLSIADPSWLVFSGGFDHSLPRRLSKRFFDLAAASLLLLMAWPVMLIVAVCVKLESPGPMLYRQCRVGE